MSEREPIRGPGPHRQPTARSYVDSTLGAASVGGGAVWLIVGAQAAGKSTVAELLARTFDRSVHVRGGAFYRIAVRGWVHHDDPKTDQARRHLDLQYRLSALAADEYAAEGFTVVAQDNIYGSDVTSWLARVRARPRFLVVLRPSVSVIERRERERFVATGKVAYRAGGVTASDLDRALGATARVGLWLDTSKMTAPESVDEILRRRHEAEIVDGGEA